MKAPPEGAGFDTTLTDGLRIAIRDVIGNASAPDERPLNMTDLARSMWPDGFTEHWRFVQGPENHDIVYHRVASNACAARPSGQSTLLVRPQPRARGHRHQPDGPRIPMLFMGQEFLEDKQWSDNFEFHKDLLLHWAGLDNGDKQMLDHLRFTRELIRLALALSRLTRPRLSRRSRP